MKVKELKEKLELIENQELEVYMYDDGELYPITLVDDSIDDRVDLNIYKGKKEYIYHLINKTTDMIIDQTSLDEENEDLAKEIFKGKDCELEDYEEIVLYDVYEEEE